MQSRVPVGRGWFAALVSLFVSLGALLVIETLTKVLIEFWFEPWPIGVSRPFGSRDYIIWITFILARLGSFTFGGFIGVLLAMGTSRLLMFLIVLLASASTLVEHIPPAGGSLAFLAVWAIAAPIGAAVGVWLAKRRGNLT